MPICNIFESNWIYGFQVSVSLQSYMRMRKGKKSRSESLVQQRRDEWMNLLDLLQYELRNCRV